MNKIALPLLAAAGLAMSVTASHAQSFGIEIDSDGPVYGYTDFGYGPGYTGRSYGYRYAAPARRSYGYSYGYRADEPVVESRSTRGGCGTYFYWDGDRCVDARSK